MSDLGSRQVDTFEHWQIVCCRPGSAAPGMKRVRLELCRWCTGPALQRQESVTSARQPSSAPAETGPGHEPEKPLYAESR